MKTIALHIKHMVCDRCIRVVREELEKLGARVHRIRLGEAIVSADDIESTLPRIRHALLANGFELLENHKAMLVEEIKTLIISLVHSPSVILPRSFSGMISSKLGYEYRYLSSLFSSLENVTIERYIILQKIERAKELLVYGEDSLSEIAHRLRYSSVQHLSQQFKQVTGFTPTAFKRLKGDRRKSLDAV